jgi:hypothetical protein
MNIGRIKTTRAESLSDDRFTIFSFLWAAAVIFHLGKWNIWLHSPVSFALGVSAVSVILKPSSAYRLYILIILQLVDAFEKMPWIPNHWLFASVVNLTILVSALILIISARNTGIERSRLFNTFAPALRLEFVLLYLFSLFHKLNTGWLDPAVSCSTRIFSSSFNHPGFLQSPLVSEILPIYGTLAAEIAIPLFLLTRRLRIAGIIVALFFHFILGTFEYYNFSAVTYAMLFLFTPDNISERLRELWNGSRIRELYNYSLDPGFIDKVKTPVLITAGAAGLALLIYTKLNYPGVQPFIEPMEVWTLGKPRLYYVFLALWGLFGSALIAVFLITLRKGEPLHYGTGRYFIPGYKILMLFPLIIAINGGSPYLGLKTQTAWSMFSNLRTEGGFTNHLIIRHPYYLADYQTDLVEIKHSSDPRLSAFHEKGYLIPYFELRRYMSMNASSESDEYKLEYVRKGSNKKVSNPGDDPVLFEPENYFLRKLLSFRPVPSDNSGVCQH